ncbi:MAG: sigma-54 dependent transcriptional regulator [Pirellulaceae bacterium]|nr:sigma-54 dependent transcriptional regulator [Pirellulaceae bacterium]
MTTALIVSPDESLCTNLRHPVSSLTGWAVETAARPAEALTSIQDHSVGAVLVDFRQEDLETEIHELLECLEKGLRGRSPRVIGIADRGYPRSVWPILDRVVSGHINLPIDSESLIQQFASIHDAEKESPAAAVEERTLTANGLSFTTRTAAMFPFLSQLARVAARDVTLLFTGETGTGKSYLAQLVHELSERRTGPFFATACGALPPDLIESELFGHVRGAFTSAVRSSEGRFEAARGGTLLLDEIDVLGPKEQSRLLHVIETGKYEPVGSTDTKIADVRLIVASNVDLKMLADRHQFRADLYYRLNVLEFHLMPLRERQSDIIPLATRFIDETCQRHGIPVTHMDSEFMAIVKQYHWPGNIRELLNQMRRAVLLSKDGILTPDSLSLDLRNEGRNQSGNGNGNGNGNGHAKLTSRSPGWNLSRRLANSEREFLVETLKAHSNNRAATARALGISRTALYKKLHRFGLVEADEGIDVPPPANGQPKAGELAVREAS